MPIMPLGLRAQAMNAGAKDELDTDRFEVFAHGATTTFGNKLVDSQGGCLTANGGNFGGRFHTVMDLTAALIFAERTCTKYPGEKPLVIAFALPSDTVATLKNHGMYQMGLISGPPTGVTASTTEYVFSPGAFQTIANRGFFFKVK
jgi:hypothetical protein